LLVYQVALSARKIPNAEIAGLGEGLRAQADGDGDGLLSGSEFIQAPFMELESFDADADGAITLEEFAAAAGHVAVDWQDC
jgi:hypothetical protein